MTRHQRRAGSAAGVAAWRLAHVPAERGAEGAGRAVADAFGDLGERDVVAAEQILCDGHAPGDQVLHRRQAHGAREALEERRARQRGRLRELGDRPRRASWPCMWRMAGASCGSANPRSSPGGASSPGVARSASMSRTSTRRVSTRSRPDRRSPASSPTSRTSTDSRSTPRTCTSAGSSETSNAASGESNANQPPSSRTSGGPPRLPWRTSPMRVDVTFGSNRTGLTGSNPDMVNPGVAGSRTKSPASSVTARWPSTARRQLPSSTAQKLGGRRPSRATPQRPAPLIRLENTARGCSSAMTSESGSFMSGRSQMKYGLHIVDRPVRHRYRCQVRG